MDFLLLIAGLAVGVALGWFIAQSRHGAVAERRERFGAAAVRGCSEAWSSTRPRATTSSPSAGAKRSRRACPAHMAHGSVAPSSLRLK